MNVSIYTLCVIKLNEEFERMSLEEDERVDLLKLLVYCTMIEAEDDDEVPPIMLRRLNCASKDRQRWIINLRNSKPFSDLDLKIERFVYKSLIKVYQCK